MESVMVGAKNNSDIAVRGMKRVIEEVIKNVNIVKCEGAICVSVNNNDRRYYAQLVNSIQKLTFV